MRSVTDYEEISRATTTIRVHTPQPPAEAQGVPVGRVCCPICRTQTVLHAGVRVEGRCPGCTVIVRVVDGRPRACGWMGGGDMRAAGLAVRSQRSRLERGEPETSPKIKPRAVRVVVDRSGAGACGEFRGSTQGYRMHRRSGEVACVECLDAHNTANRESKARVRRQAAA